MERDLNTYTESILNNVDVGILLKDNFGTVTFVNKNLEELFGYSYKELVGLPNKEIISLFMGDHLREEIIGNCEQVKQGDTVIRRRRIRHKSGQNIPLEVNAKPLYEGNALAGEMLMFRDLHEHLIATVTRLINSSLDLNTVLHNTTSAVVENVGLASCAIFLLEDGDTLRLAACNAFSNPEDCKKVTFKLGEGPPGIIAQERRAVYVDNLRTDTSLPEFARQFHGDKSSIGYPLIFNDELLGVVAFDADVVRLFSEKEQRLFENLTNQIALAIYNAKLFAKLEHLSVTDGLTGVYNHRYLKDRLQIEVERAKRTNGSLSLLMLDVDNFKRYNDTHGHIYGDKLLKEIALLINQNVRTFDVVARYGGEEFAVILLDCSDVEALNIATRIRAIIEGHDFYGRESQPGGQVTISIGLSSFLKHFSRNKLLYSADKALYKAKRQGRNRVEVYAS